MRDRRVRIRTPSRLHFGLLGWGPGSRRQFGGLGLMIQNPAIELVAERADFWEFEGPLSDRAGLLVLGLHDRLSAMGIDPGPARIRILRAPPEHVGLGVGTQVSLAVTSALLLLAGAVEPSVEELARLTGTAIARESGFTGSTSVA